MSKRTRWILIAAVVLGALVVLRLVLTDSALEVEMALIERGTLEVTVSEEGRTRVRERYQVAAPVSGRLARITLDEGDAVEVGAPIARIYPTPEGAREVGVARARVTAAESRRAEAAARVADAEAQFVQLEREAGRSRALARDSILSRSELERAELAEASARRRLDAARATLRAAEADVAAARATLIGAGAQGDGEAVTIVAPGGGTILRVLEENERVVPAGTPLVEVGDATGLEVVVDVLSEDAVRIRPGSPVRIEEWGGEEVLHGSVRLVEPAAFTKISALGVEEQRVNVIADLFEPPPELGSGYRVEAQIVTWSGADVLIVPTSALFRQEGAWYVFAAEDGTATRRRVHIGHRGTDAAEVLDGLDEGDRVILFPSDQIEDGVEVQARSS